MVFFGIASACFVNYYILQKFIFISHWQLYLPITWEARVQFPVGEEGLPKFKVFIIQARIKKSIFGQP